MEKIKLLKDAKRVAWIRALVEGKNMYVVWEYAEHKRGGKYQQWYFVTNVPGRIAQFHPQHLYWATITPLGAARWLANQTRRKATTESTR